MVTFWVGAGRWFLVSCFVGFGVRWLLLVVFGVLRVMFGLGVALMLLEFWLYG